jgi:hypothetical protein
MAGFALAAALAASAAAQAPFTAHAGVTAQATATVRIVAGERIEFRDQSNRDRNDRYLRETKMLVDGAWTPARLTEFF